ncbi:hypothetical protein [Sulfobacillus harzensis]|uniref:Uncharacterized protein n=1 Tax=Sulfobacillus harzensis TaxID=2729629 RepID=A0A7Y0L2R1_9FIRM|nr:hypothetical protein [Sulfobacillus harzensis]NMP21922.1 hypothetical protein [Sulfobacillus harzensis]
MLLTSDVQDSVKQALANMTESVTVKLFLKPGEESSNTMRELWGELQALTPKLIIEESESVPSGMDASQMEGAVSEVWQNGTFTGVRYLGIPSGYEFGPLIETLVEVSRGDAPELSESVVAWLKKLEKPLHFQVFVTPT